MSATEEQIEAEYWAYQYQDNKVGEEIEDEDFDLDTVVAGFAQPGNELAALKQRAALNRAAVPVEAPVDDWEEVNLD